MELSQFLQECPKMLPRLARVVSERHHVEYDEAYQTALIVTNEFLPNLVFDIDGNVRKKSDVEHFVEIQHATSKFKYIVSLKVYSYVVNRLKYDRKKQDTFEDALESLEGGTCALPTYPVTPEQQVVADDLAQKLVASVVALAKRPGGPSPDQYKRALRDVLAAAGYGEYNEETSRAWLAQHGSSSGVIPRTFIFEFNGLSRKQGRTMVNRIAKVADAVGLKG